MIGVPVSRKKGPLPRGGGGGGNPIHGLAPMCVVPNRVWFLRVFMEIEYMVYRFCLRGHFVTFYGHAFKQD